MNFFCTQTFCSSSLKWNNNIGASYKFYKNVKSTKINTNNRKEKINKNKTNYLVPRAKPTQLGQATQGPAPLPIFFLLFTGEAALLEK